VHAGSYSSWVLGHERRRPSPDFNETQASMGLHSLVDFGDGPLLSAFFEPAFVLASDTSYLVWDVLGAAKVLGVEALAACLAAAVKRKIRPVGLVSSAAVCQHTSVLMHAGFYLFAASPFAVSTAPLHVAGLHLLCMCVKCVGCIQLGLGHQHVRQLAALLHHYHYHYPHYT
jgi:hypothetical protein